MSSPGRSRIPSAVNPVRWVAAAVIAVSLHAAAVGVWFVHFSSAPPDVVTATAIAMDMAPLPTAPPVPERDIPTPQQVEAPKPTPKKSPTLKPLPFTPPPETALADAKPEVVLPTQPEREPDKPSSSQPPADQNTRNAAPDMPPDKKVAAPQEGGYNSGDDNPEMLWYSQIIGKVQKLKRYPMRSRVRGEQDDVVVALSLDRSGKVVSVEIQRSSGFELLDRESIDVVRRASPFPEAPPEVLGEVIRFSVVIQFAMGGKPTSAAAAH